MTTLNISGNFYAGNSLIIDRTSTSLVLNVVGNFTTGNSATITANVSVGGNIKTGNSTTITGNITSTGGSITAGNSLTITGQVSARDDITAGNNVTFTGQVSAGDNIITGNSATITGNIIAGGTVTTGASTTHTGTTVEGTRKVSIANTSVVEGNSGTTGAIFAVTLNSASSRDVTVNYASSSGTATGGSVCAGSTDYVNTTGTLTISPRSTTGTITVPICGDTTYERDETFTVSLSSPVNATLGTATATGTILNDDAPALVAEYHFDETKWSGTAGEVKDSSSNGYHATASLAVVGNGSPGPAYSSAGQSTCGFGVFDGGSISKSYVQLPSSFPGLSGSFSLTAWVNSTNASAQHQRIFVRDDADDGWALSLADGTNTGVLRFFNRNVTFNTPLGGMVSSGGVAIDTTFQLSSNTWYFVALTVDTVGKSAVMYAYDTNGVQRSKMSASFTGTWGAGTGATSIGGETSASSEGRQTSWHFLGRIDEVRIFSDALTQTLVEALLTTRRSCSVGPDHYELSLPTSSIACLSTTATVTACADSSSPCTNKSTAVSGKTATLTTNGGTLAATTLTFDATGVVSTTLSYPAAVDATAVLVTLSGEQAAATNARQCCPNGSNCSVANSCSTTFNTAGFIISATAAGAAATIPSQTAGAGSGTYYLRAVTSSTTTAACTTALTGATTVNWAYQCNNPTTCSSSNLMSLNGGTATAIQRNDNAGVLSYASVPMTFDAGGSAPFTFNFADVGRTTLWATKTVNAATLSGSTNAFVTKPGGFVISNIKQTATPFLANPAAATATDAKFIKAGESFTATITATASGGATTPSYGRETSPEGVLLTRTLVLPSGGNAATLSNGAIAGGNFSSGVASVTNLAWDEVGIITMTPSVADGDYLGAGDVTGTTSANVGRFIPDRFSVTPAAPVASCIVHPAAGAGYVPTDFTYFSQPAGFSTPFTLTALNVAGVPTKNYTGVFARLSAAGWAWTDINSVNGLRFGTNALLPAGSALAVAAPGGAAVVPNGIWINGAVALTSVVHQVSRPTALAGETAITITALPIDSDGVTMAAAAAVSSSSTALRFGRLRMSNAYGSERLDLPVPISVQYFDTTAGSFRTNPDDSCTDLSVPVARTLVGAATPNGLANLYFYPVVAGKNQLLSTDTVPTVTNAAGAAVTTVTGGVAVLRFPRPAKSGWLDIILGTPHYLRFNWGNCMGQTTPGADSPRDDLACARATFGVYKSPLIYRRENY